VPDDLAVRLAEALAPWFARAHRDLAWRRTTDPYAIWVSEVMLQQTRVETVERYWDAFLRRFPDVGTLAAADEDSVLAAWSGLGYYRRARLLHAGARHVARALGGELPRDPAALREIPGVGRYTAGAIASIAHDVAAPLVDGNVARVLSRVQALADPREQDASAAGHWKLCARVLAHGSPRVLAQALMELGATVCTPKAPRCAACPIARECRARADGSTDAIPAPRRRPEQPLERWIAVAATWQERLLLVRRPDEGLLAGLWCLPLVAVASTRASIDEAAIARAVGVPIAIDGARGKPLRHVFTHRIWELRPLSCRAEAAPRDRPRAAMWIGPGDRPPGGIPSLTAKLLARVGW
jgi:A/G-specific adenine glycosylase